MARANTRTLLSLDDYARIMGIPGWIFNQMEYPGRHIPGCDGVIYQDGYAGDPTFFVGRQEIADAIAVAEGQIAAVLGYWPGPKFICDEVVEWINPVRGSAQSIPTLRAKWGYLQAFGVEAFDTVRLSAPVVYVGDVATIEIASLYSVDVEDACNVIVTFEGTDPGWLWEIRPLSVVIAEDGTITITGDRWLFTNPAVWENDTVASFTDVVSTVDVHYRSIDASAHGRMEWDAVCGDFACASSTLGGCCQIKDKRLSLFTMRPAEYDETDGWQKRLWQYGYPPNRAVISYLAGYDEDACEDCSQMGMRMKSAIARLANTHIIDVPCGCSIFRNRFDTDRKVVETMSRMVARAEQYFGSPTQGAIFALSVLDQIDSIGRGG